MPQITVTRKRLAQVGDNKDTLMLVTESITTVDTDTGEAVVTVSPAANAAAAATGDPDCSCNLVDCPFKPAAPTSVANAAIGDMPPL